MPKNTKPEGYKTGRPTVDLKPEEVAQVERLAQYLNQAQIAAVLGISADTFRRIKRTNESVDLALKKGRAAVVSRVAESLIKNATEKNNVLAQIFALKTLGGWVESQPEQERQTISIQYSPAQGRPERDITPEPDRIEGGQD
jgi:predicted DNA-binding protein (UPF0251 family)